MRDEEEEDPATGSAAATHARILMRTMGEKTPQVESFLREIFALGFFPAAGLAPSSITFDAPPGSASDEKR